MNDKTVGGVHWSFWAIGAVALIWNVMGVINFFAQMNADALAGMPESYRAIIEGRPAWATGAFAIAVFGGALGLPSTSAEEVGCVLFVYCVATWHDCANAFLPWHDPCDNRRRCLPVGGGVLIWYSKQAESKGWIS